MRAPRFALLFTVFCVLLVSCKTGEKITRSGAKPITVNKLVSNIEENRFDYPHFSAKRINFSIDNRGDKNSFRASLQMTRDKQISLTIMKLSIPVGRVSLTPDSIIFLNYFERTYVAEKIDAMESLLGFSADFNMVQTLLTGDVMSFFPKEKLKKFDLSIDNDFYKLQSNESWIVAQTAGELTVSQILYFDPDLFALRKMILEDENSSRKMQLEMNDYEKVGQKYYPATININFDSGNGIFKFEAKMSGFSIEKEEIAAVKIPDNYSRLYIRKR